MLGIESMSKDDVILSRNGDKAAFGRLVSAHTAVVCAIATAIVGSAVAGEEVGQEVFVYAWQELPSLRDPARFGPWVKQIARNRAHDAVRKQARRRELHDTQTLEQLASPHTETGERIDEARQEAALWSSFRELEGEDREVLALFYRQGGSVRELAEQLALSEPAARKRLSRARGRLREEVMVALGQSLARTAPGAVFAAAVLAALAPRAARAQPVARESRLPRSAWATSVCAAAVAVILAWWSVPCTAVPPGPHPSETRSGRAHLSAKQPAHPPAVRAVTEDDDERIALSVRLGSWNVSRGAFQMIYMFRPGQFWPTADEVRLPEGQGVQAVLDYLHAAPEAPISDALSESLSELRELREGVLPNDPWAALLAIEVERLDALYRWRAARSDFALRHALPDPNVVGWSAYNAVRATLSEEEPPLALSPMLHLALAARATWPDHPVTDYADLYILHAYADFSSASTFDPKTLADEAIDVLSRSHDPLVLDAATQMLANAVRDTTLSPLDLDVLDEIYAGLSAGAARYAMADLALVSTLRLGDKERMGAWMQRYDEAVEQRCAELFNEEQCATVRDERDHRSGFVAAVSPVAPVTWQAALIADVERCHAGGHTLDVALTGVGRFDGGWSWRSWSGSRDFAACIAAAPARGPAPPRKVKVSLEVLPPLP